LRAIWSQPEAPRPDRQAEEDLLKRLVKGGQNWRKILSGVSKLVTQLTLEQVGLTRNAVSLPFQATGETPLTGSSSGRRQIATAAVDMKNISRIRAMTLCSLNHIALTCIDGALRRYLADQGIELDRPLSIQMPVNLRGSDNDPTGNMIGIVLVELASKTDDPYQRLREIGFTLRAVRNQIDSVPSIAVAQYTAVLAVLLELVQILKLDKLLPGIADTLVSNVPGPAEPMYMAGAKMVDMVPISTLPPGSNMNITLYSYAGVLHFGLIATPEVTGLPKLASYIEEAFEELEEAVFSPA
jgi:WS/DGAT/MGAT family acyltransferase